MLKLEFLKQLGLLGIGGASALASRTSVAIAATEEIDLLVGLWEMTVVGSAGTYRYIYTISRGVWVATGNIDEGYLQFKYSPSMGCYERAADGAYRYSERGWTFDRRGINVGTFRSIGTFRLDTKQKSFKGPGKFTQFDLREKPILVEPFTVTATKIIV